MIIPYTNFTPNRALFLQRAKERNDNAVFLLKFLAFISLGFYSSVESLFLGSVLHKGCIHAYELLVTLTFGVYLFGKIQYLIAIGREQNLSASLWIVGIGGTGSIVCWIYIASYLPKLNQGYFSEIFANLSLIFAGATALFLVSLIGGACVIKNSLAQSLCKQHIIWFNPVVTVLVTSLTVASLGFYVLLDLDILLDSLANGYFDFDATVSIVVFSIFIFGHILYIFGLTQHDKPILAQGVWVIGFGGSMTSALWISVWGGFISLEFDLMVEVIEVFSLPLAALTLLFTILLMTVGGLDEESELE